MGRSRSFAIAEVCLGLAGQERDPSLGTGAGQQGDALAHELVGPPPLARLG
ncbi:hypothetical protein ACFWIO_21530 [Streptomyces diastatochromogenes]|uniref:hypothetical protein n=1 Tax=Streptomyces diastatochromogenes TaxID=42236 RepID=UPI00364790C3